MRANAWCYNVTPQGVVTQWDAFRAPPRCVTWSNSTVKWESDGIGTDAVRVESDGAAVVTCRTYHLSTFTTFEEETAHAEMNSVDLLGDYAVLREVCCAQRYQLCHKSHTHVRSSTCIFACRCALIFSSYMLVTPQHSSRVQMEKSR